MSMFVAIFSVAFCCYASAAVTPCDPSKLPQLLGCMKSELLPNGGNIDTAIQMGQQQLKKCFMDNSCAAPSFDVGIESVIFQGSDKDFQQQIQKAFADVKSAKQCIMENTMGKIMGYCNFDQETQMQLTKINNSMPRMNGLFGKFQTGTTVLDLEDVHNAMEKLFVTKLGAMMAFRMCNETNPANGAKTGTCITKLKQDVKQTSCKAIQACAPKATDVCSASFTSLHQQLCNCHKDIVDYASSVLDKVSKDKTSKNEDLVKMLIEGLHIQEMVASIKNCFDPSSDLYKGLTFVDALFKNPDSDQSKAIFKNLDVKAFLSAGKDMMDAMRENEFCEMSC